MKLSYDFRQMRGLIRTCDLPTSNEAPQWIRSWKNAWNNVVFRRADRSMRAIVGYARFSRMPMATLSLPIAVPEGIKKVGYRPQSSRSAIRSI